MFVRIVGCIERMCSGLWLERDHGKEAIRGKPQYAAAYRTMDLEIGTEDPFAWKVEVVAVDETEDLFISHRTV